MVLILDNSMKLLRTCEREFYFVDASRAAEHMFVVRGPARFSQDIHERDQIPKHFLSRLCWFDLPF